jgi:hypothetical protein
LSANGADIASAGQSVRAGQLEERVALSAVRLFRRVSVPRRLPSSSSSSPSCASALFPSLP